MNLKYCPEVIELVGGALGYKPDYLAPEAALRLFEHCRSFLDWEQSLVMVYGKAHPIPRLNAWYGDDNISYQYSGTRFLAHAWTPELKSLCLSLNVQLDANFNSVLANFYRSGSDAMGWHSDDEPELGSAPVIACVSVGCERVLRFRHKQRAAPSFGMPLESGSLLVMGAGLQSHWQHSLPRRATAGPRISLTFRQVFKSVDHIA
ncbi:alpha-ketoglutarate-dependent dioxygenase AlkB family protein [Simiduia aestuariiviva]|uniref:Alkylated DNA repair dioxygenase AlkB n=1 Tax=Simiduia aestuariiviva TaxID=1510459 RepID=A0A839UP02_9GAMM|nr:alpha-ketoglutarate-dependent dioxygenase AlkB [Simiduia aestuariiviva]MBB3168461.1 alkylated DNA repair dioxygenase AlkB [Simiduia aestuariiviva]